MNPSDLRLVTGLGVLLFVAGCGSSASSQPTSEGTGGKTTSTGGATTGSGGQGGVGNSTSSGGTATSGGASGTGATGTGGSGPPAFDAGTDPQDNVVQPGSVCDRIATIQCAAEQHCCFTPGLRSFDDCKTAQKAGCVANYLDDITTPPYQTETGYDPNAAQPIFTQFETLASTCDLTVTAWGASATGLRALTPGTPRTSCTPDPDELLPQLDKPAIAAHLASCPSASATACLPNSALQVPNWTCAPLSSEGGPCFSDVNCVEPAQTTPDNGGLYCDNPNAAASGAKCAQRKPVGAACALGNECASLLCRGSVCAELNQQNAYCL